MSPATGPGTTLGRIAELEARYAELRERLDRFEREVLEAAWPRDKRDPASTTGGSATLATPPRTRHMDQPPPPAPAPGPGPRGFGFTRDVTA